MIRLKALLVAAASIATTGVALAEDEEDAPPDGDGEAPAPAPASPPPLVLGKDKILIAGSTLNISVSAGAAGEPVSLAPSVWYGLKEKLTVGITHDNGATPWSPRPALLAGFGVDLGGNPATFPVSGGICPTGSDNGCDDPYGTVGFDALYSLKQGKLSLAGHPALDLADFAPFVIQLRVGLLGRYVVNDKISVVVDPRIELNLTDRDFSKDVIDLPAWAWYAVNARLGAYVHTGLAGSFAGFGDVFRIPLQVGASVTITAKVAAGIDFAFTNLVGAGGGFGGRALGLRFAYALSRK